MVADSSDESGVSRPLNLTMQSCISLWGQTAQIILTKEDRDLRKREGRRRDKTRDTEKKEKQERCDVTHRENIREQIMKEKKRL